MCLSIYNVHLITVVKYNFILTSVFLTSCAKDRYNTIDQIRYHLPSPGPGSQGCPPVTGQQKAPVWLLLRFQQNWMKDTNSHVKHK